MATTAKTTKSKPAAVQEVPEATQATEGETSSIVVKKPEFIERVVARSGLKKKDVKPALEAILAQLADELTEDKELSLPPFGKIMVNRTKDTANGTVVIAKVKLSKPVVKVDGNSSETPLADEDE
jgi:nucleoid DNA-binding protein